MGIRINGVYINADVTVLLAAILQDRSVNYPQLTMGHAKEISIRIEIARSTFIRMEPLMCCNDPSLDPKMRIVRRHFLPMLLYLVQT